MGAPPASQPGSLVCRSYSFDARLREAGGEARERSDSSAAALSQQQLWLARAMTVDAGNPVYASQLGWVEDSVFRLEDEERAAYAPPDVAAESAKEKARRRSEKTRRRALRRIQARRTGVAAPSLSPSSSGGSSTEPPPPSGLQLPDAVFARQ